jgi:SNF2 family DNA or RNA helicase
LGIVKEAVKLNENVLIFVHSLPILEYLEDKLRRRNNTTVYVLKGSTPMKDRQVSIDRFNRDVSSVYLISSKVSWLLTV